ncbi:MAG: hypothetical protein K6357_08850 [Elusimicrobiota bacterium]
MTEWVKTDSQEYKWLCKEGVEALLIEVIKQQQRLKARIDELESLTK